MELVPCIFLVLFSFFFKSFCCAFWYFFVNLSDFFLLENQANPNIGNEFNVTPLMIAGYNDMIYLSSLLIYYGADINAKTKINNLSIKDIIRESIGFNVENLMTEFND